MPMQWNCRQSLRRKNDVKVTPFYPAVLGVAAARRCFPPLSHSHEINDPDEETGVGMRREEASSGSDSPEHEKVVSANDSPVQPK